MTDDMSDDDRPQGAQQEDFARMLEESLQQTESFTTGQTVEGEIVALQSDVAFIDIGGKGEATLDLEELRDEDGEIAARVGDRVQAVVVSTAGGLKLSRRLARGSAAREQLADAFHAGLPVEGRVEAVNKGGFEIRVAGQRAFCPLSQIDTVRVADPAEHQGRVYAFRILEYKENGRNIVVSRRALLEEEQRARAEEIRRGIVPDAELEGRVASLTGFGAFIDLGAGVQGLLHISEMSWTRVGSADEVVQPGQEIRVRVLKVEEDGRKISLSLKALQEDPWLAASRRYEVGQVHQGRITRISEFGAFVELEPGVEALAHMSAFPKVPGGWRNAVRPGESDSFRVLSIDTARRRIGVALHQGMAEAEAESAAAAAGGDAGASATGEGRSDRAAGGRTGAAAAGGRPDSDAGGGFGSLADKLRAALKPDS